MRFEVLSGTYEMDAAPNCAICNAPAYPECPCESERLQIAVKQAEQRAMDERMAEIRDWVINHARQHILFAFERLTSTRKQAHTAYLNSLPNYEVYMRYSGHPPIHPMYIAQLQGQITEAHAELKRGIDADWRASVLRYPEILDYFYSLIELRTPNERSSRVTDPPFALAGYADRGYAPDPSMVSPTSPTSKRMSMDKKKKRRDSGAAQHATLHRVMRGPPPVPTPPVMHGAFARPPAPYPF